MPNIVPRYPYSNRSVTIGFGPGPLSPAIKALIWTNVGVFLVQQLALVVRWRFHSGWRAGTACCAVQRSGCWASSRSWGSRRS